MRPEKSKIRSQKKTRFDAQKGSRGKQSVDDYKTTRATKEKRSSAASVND